MADPLVTVASLLAPAFDQVAGRSGVDPVVRPSDRAHAQANGALPLAKELGRNPREVAEAVVAAAALDGVASLEVAGPGFINVTFSPGFVASQVTEVAGDDHVGVRPVALPETVVIDYSAPNVAKEMHVGHLRTTVIGDALVRMLEFVGQRVIRRTTSATGARRSACSSSTSSTSARRSARSTVTDPNALLLAGPREVRRRRRVQGSGPQRGSWLLQAAATPRRCELWQRLVDLVGRLLRRRLRQARRALHRDDLAGESLLPADDAGGDRAPRRGRPARRERRRQGACSSPGSQNREGEPLPLIVRRSHGRVQLRDERLACVIDRVERLARRPCSCTVIGAPQSQHLQMVCEATEMARWLRAATRGRAREQSATSSATTARS
jgi:arginyl-tRNA synthetase